jgi:large subunit ribosomal protein L29
MKIKELRNKSKEELEKLLEEYREKLRQLYFDIHLKKIKNVREVRAVKKTIARILTLLNSLKHNK